MPPVLLHYALTLVAFCAMHAAVLAVFSVALRAAGRATLSLRLDRTGARWALEFVATEALMLTAALHLRVVTLSPWSLGRSLAVLAAATLWWEAWFYLGHRLLHARWLYAWHRPHHADRGVHPSLCFSAGETALLSSGFYAPLAVSSHALHAVSAPTLAMTFAVAYALNVSQHLDAREGALDRAPLRHLLNSARYHARHHARSRGNYGLVTPWLDRLFATELR